MRCKNCGWDNPAGQLRCEKCNMPLDGSILGRPPAPAPSGNAPMSSNAEEIQGTIKGALVSGPFLDEQKEMPQAREGNSPKSSGDNDNGFVSCSKCNAPVREGTTECPYCEAQIVPTKPALAETSSRQNVSPPSTDPVQEGVGGTIRRRQASRASGFTLTIAESAETANPPVMSFEGNNHVVNRANLEPGNKTITSKEQAEIELIDGVWYLKNLSQLKSTFIRVEDDQPIPLKPGATILFGDREFTFKPEE